MLTDASYVAVTLCALAFIALGYAVDTDSALFDRFRLFGFTAELYWALGFWLFFALALVFPGTPPWLTILDGMVASGCTLHFLHIKWTARRSRRPADTPKEPNT